MSDDEVTTDETLEPEQPDKPLLVVHGPSSKSIAPVYAIVSSTGLGSRGAAGIVARLPDAALAEIVEIYTDNRNDTPARIRAVIAREIPPRQPPTPPAA